MCPDDVIAIRRATGLSQAKFAEKFGLSMHSLSHWEQGDRKMEKMCRLVLRIIEHRPDVVEHIVAMYTNTDGDFEP